MRPSAIIASGLALLSTASARIEGFAAPSQVAVDGTIRIEIEAFNYIQSVQDVAMAFGISSTPYPGSLGTLLSEKFLGPDLSNTIGNITHYVHIPATWPVGPATITGALYSLYGAVLSPTISTYALNVTVGNATSGDYIGSTYVPPLSAANNASSSN